MIRKRGVDLADEKNLTEEQKSEEINDTAEKAEQADAQSVETTESEEQTEQAEQAQLTELEKKLDETEDKYLRAQAEIANMQTRYKKEQERLLKYQGQSIAKAILPAVDNLQRALQIEVDDENSKQLKKGVEMVANDIQNALSSNDVVQMDALNQKFDPKFHQAVKTVPVEKGQESDTVVQVYQEGYMLKDRVLRPAMVVVAQ
ncbi:MAG TPA: nucleotide exchange factor GrpE [Candidatus Ligilactobacillus excrementipullorum]|nr:nucleotide exchange factor GrpE [Candidatus Ligilactobacillus excrementipullorum]